MTERIVFVQIGVVSVQSLSRKCKLFATPRMPSVFLSVPLTQSPHVSLIFAPERTTEYATLYTHGGTVHLRRDFLIMNNINRLCSKKRLLFHILFLLQHSYFLSILF